MKDEFEDLRDAEELGKRIQANRGTEDSPRWETLLAKAQWVCPVHLYRVHPEDV